MNANFNMWQKAEGMTLAAATQSLGTSSSDVRLCPKKEKLEFRVLFCVTSLTPSFHIYFEPPCKALALEATSMRLARIARIQTGIKGAISLPTRTAVKKDRTAMTSKEWTV
jgi:hypothetical protein